MQIHSRNPEKTQQVASEIGTKLQAGDILLLNGELVAGKTTFTKFLAEALGVQNDITSPTFTLMDVHPVPEHKSINQLVHIDTYRMEQAEDLIDIGITDYLGADDTLCVIEWPEKIKDLLAKYDTKTISFEHAPDGTRVISYE